ncbi:translocation/assembly module TamB domain-containing protein [Coxiella-like endosymbiont]|uniref:translocation/assembly module TamB domain-containing protein n=1 Tax=Coxiella-like endosymbiont TaxID=1592897 RepID=UPI00272C6097|nr:translocation/assembly module TamB domain-containing protein [Coxiella-like endosymbiont]
MITKWITGVIIGLTILILALTLMFTTPIGLRVGLKIIKKIIPGEFTYSTVSGFVRGPLNFTNFNYRHNGLNITIDKLEIDWQPLYFLRDQVSISHLAAKNTKIILSHQLDGEKIRNPLKERLPIALHIESGSFSNLIIQRNVKPYPIHIKNLLLHNVALNNSLIATMDGQMIQPFPVNIHLISSGTCYNYSITLRAKNRNIDWLITSKGTQEWIEAQTHEAHTLHGWLNAFVKIQFEPTFRWQIEVDIAHLNLQRIFNKWPHQLTLQLRTEGYYENKTDLIPNFTVTGRLQSQKAYIYITGQHQQRWNLNWITNVKDFSNLFATARGTLQGHGTITGPSKSPIIMVDMIGHNIAFPNIKINKLESHWHIDPLFNQAFALQLHAQQIQTPTLQLSQLEVNARGQPHAHHVKADMLIDDRSSGKFIITLAGAGNIQNKVWSRNFHRFNIQSQKFGDWNADQPVKITISENQTILAPICLHSGQNHMCFQGQWRIKPVSFIRGKLTINFNDLGLISAILPDTIQPHGQLIANLDISGSSTQPAIHGTVELRQGSIDFPGLRVSLTQAQASIEATRSTIHYHLEGYSQNQPVQIVGQTQLNIPGYPTTFSFRDENVLIVNTHQYIIYGSPDLRIDIAGRNVDITGTLIIPRAILKPTTFSRSAILTGDAVFVGPEAEKESFWGINMDIQVMLGDQVVIDSLGAKGRLEGKFTLLKTASQPLIANGRITIIDGTFTTHGRTLDITTPSSISFIQSPITNPILGIRAVRILRTSFIVAKPGPSVGLEGVVTIGLNIEGTLHHPEVSLYASDPDLTQADILSYLIFGHSANTNTPNNVNFLVDAINTLNIGGGKTSVGGIVDQITQGLGITELGIEPQTRTTVLETPTTSPTQSAFVVGRYLLPRLYVRYSRGITTPINIVQLRYLISENWAIQTEASSLGNGVDILYSIERN